MLLPTAFRSRPDWVVSAPQTLQADSDAVFSQNMAVACRSSRVLGQEGRLATAAQCAWHGGMCFNPTLSWLAGCLCLAGVIPIAHNSGGPQADIVVDMETDAGPQRTGYLAATLEEYCRAITTVCQTRMAFLISCVCKVCGSTNTL